MKWTTTADISVKPISPTAHAHGVPIAHFKSTESRLHMIHSFRLRFQRQLCCSVCLLLTATTSVDAQLQASTNSVAVVGQGTASVSVDPQMMRVLISLRAEGKSLESAAAAMKETVEAAKLELTAIGALKDSFKTDALNVDNQLGEKYARLRSQMMSYGGGSRFGGRGRSGPPEPKVSDVVRVKQYIVADWELKETGFALLAQTVDITKKLKTIDFGGSSATSDLSPEETEMLEEAGMFSDEDEDKSGPKIFYISSISLKQKNALREEAVQTATSNATQLAELVDKTIGDVVMIQSSEAEDSAYSQMAMRGYSYGGGYGRGEETPQDLIMPKSRQKTVKVSPKASSQKFQISLKVGFEFSK